jgi:hypothetical protein
MANQLSFCYKVLLKKYLKPIWKFSVAKNEKIYNKNHHVPIFGFNV